MKAIAIEPNVATSVASGHDTMKLNMCYAQLRLPDPKSKDTTSLDACCHDYLAIEVTMAWRTVKGRLLSLKNA